MKKILAATAAVALALSLSACAGGTATNQASNANNQNANANTTQTTTSLSEEAFDQMSNAINSILADEWEGYDCTSSIREKDKTVTVYVSAPTGTKDRLVNGDENLMADWETFKQDMIKQNAAIKEAAAALPGVQVSTYLIEGLDVEATGDAISAGTYNPTDYLLLVKDSAVEYDCLKS